MLDGRLIQCGIKYSNHANKGDWGGGLDQLQQLDTHAQTKGWEIREDNGREMQQDMHDRTTCLRQHQTQYSSECMHHWSLGDRTLPLAASGWAPAHQRRAESRRHDGPRALRVSHRRVRDLAGHSRARRSRRAHTACR